MTFIKENYPIVGFIVSYLITKNLILAAAIWSGLSLSQIIVHYFTKKEIKKSHIALFFVGIALVALAYYFNNDNFIKWKASIAVWVGALFILIRQIFSKKYIILDLTKSSGLIKDTAPEALLAKVNWLWIIVLTLYGGLNLYIAFTFNTNFWFYFKLISMFIMLLGLMIISIVLLKDHIHLEDEPSDS